MNDRDLHAETISPEELSELLADTTGESVEEIETGIDGYEIPPPWEGTPVDE